MFKYLIHFWFRTNEQQFKYTLKSFEEGVSPSFGCFRFNASKILFIRRQNAAVASTLANSLYL